METPPTRPPIQEDTLGSVEEVTLPEIKETETKDATTEEMKPKDLESMSIEELRAALLETQRARDESLRREGKLRSKHAQDDAYGPSNSSVCYFFDKLPRELRDRIYKYLLVNPDLSTTKFLKGWGVKKDIDGIKKYNLSPQMLRVCRQALHEGSFILYDSNRFIIEFVTMNDRPSLPENSPIFRHAVGKVPNPVPYPKTKLVVHFPWARKVKHWKVILTTNQQERLCAPDLMFTNFCRFLIGSDVRSLEVLLLPRGKLVTRNRLYRQTPAEFFAAEDVLRPLQLLRNLTSFHLDEVRGQDLPIYDTSSGTSTLTYNNIPSQLSNNIKTMVESNIPTDHVFRMYTKLVNYASAFERNTKFKEAMRPTWGERLQGMPDQWATTMNRGNPYKHDKNDIEVFKQSRNPVLDYLEPQYKRIVSASSTMVEFVKALKKAARHFTIDSQKNQDWESDLISSCLLHLEDYAKTFIRDAPYGTRLEIRKQQRKFDLIYASMEREVLMKKLSEASEVEQCMTHRLPWKTWFMAAVDGMDKQYLEIRTARKELFNYDRADDQDHGCGINLELWRCDEMIDWTVNEPILLPYNLPTDAERRQYEEVKRAEAIVTEDEASAAQDPASAA